jgi:hypothetical protein
MEKKRRKWLFIGVFVISLSGMLLMNLLFFRPGGSIELYQKMSNSNYVEFSKLLENDFKDRFTEEDYEKIKKSLDSENPNQISEYTIIKNKDSWIIVNVSPDGKGTILNIKEINDIEVLKSILH